MSEIIKVSRDEFVARWSEHIGDFKRLELNLTPDQWGELDKAVESLRALVDRAADNREKGVA